MPDTDMFTVRQQKRIEGWRKMPMGDLLKSLVEEVLCNQTTSDFCYVQEIVDEINRRFGPKLNVVTFDEEGMNVQEGVTVDALHDILTSALGE